MARMFNPLKLRDELTEKEKKFISLYNGENLDDAVMGAGYNCKDLRSAHAVGNSLLRKEKIMRALQGADILQKRADISDKTERMRFLTAVMRDPKQPILARIRATELMGKALGDYVERHEVDVNTNLLVLDAPMRQDTLQMAKQLVLSLTRPPGPAPAEAKPVIDVDVMEIPALPAGEEVLVSAANE